MVCPMEKERRNIPAARDIFFLFDYSLAFASFRVPNPKITFHLKLQFQLKQQHTCLIVPSCNSEMTKFRSNRT